MKTLLVVLVIEGALLIYVTCVTAGVNMVAVWHQIQSFILHRK